jgi:hypothetical protein
MNGYRPSGASSDFASRPLRRYWRLPTTPNRITDEDATAIATKITETAVLEPVKIQAILSRFLLSTEFSTLTGPSACHPSIENQHLLNYEPGRCYT